MLKIDITKNLDKFVLHVDIGIKTKSFISVTGQSGAGKTSLLRAIAGLDSFGGLVQHKGELWSGEGLHVDIARRNIAFVFSDYALFENMSALQNLLFISQDLALAKELLLRLQMWEYKDQNAKNLSAGQKQRVAIARALMSKPELLLLDEPFSALDIATKKAAIELIKDLHVKHKMTVIMISHNPSEIHALSDLVLLMEEGKIIQTGTPSEVLQKSNGSQKFALNAQVLQIEKQDALHVVTLSIGEQITKAVLSSGEASFLSVGDSVKISTKAFALNIAKI